MTSERSPADTAESSCPPLNIRQKDVPYGATSSVGLREGSTIMLYTVHKECTK